MKTLVQNDGIYAFNGKIDASNENREPSFIIDSIVDVEELKKSSFKEVHVQLSAATKNDDKMFELREFLFGTEGKCSLYLHIDSENNSYVIQCSPRFTVPSDDEFVTSLSDKYYVEKVWRN